MIINKKEQMISELKIINEDVSNEIEKRLYTKENIHGYKIEYDSGYPESSCSSLLVLVKVSKYSVYRMFEVCIYKRSGRFDINEVIISKGEIDALLAMENEQIKK